MMKKIIFSALMLFPAVSFADFDKAFGTIPSPDGNIIVIIRSSQSSLIPHENIISDIVKSTYGKTPKFRFVSGLPWNIGSFSSNSLKFSHFSEEGSFDRYKSEALGKQFLQNNADYLLRLFGEKENHILFIEIDSHWDEKGMVNRYSLCSALVNRSLHIEYIGTDFRRKKEKEFNRSVQDKYVETVSSAIKGELVSLGYYFESN